MDKNDFVYLTNTRQVQSSQDTLTYNPSHLIDHEMTHCQLSPRAAYAKYLRILLDFTSKRLHTVTMDTSDKSVQPTKSPVDAKLVKSYAERLQGALAVGLDWDTAIVALNIPIDVLTVLEVDPDMISTRENIKANMELELLEMHRVARRIAASKGQGRPIEWMLEQVRPDKYGRKDATLPANPAIVKDDL